MLERITLLSRIASPRTCFNPPPLPQAVLDKITFPLSAASLLDKYSPPVFLPLMIPDLFNLKWLPAKDLNAMLVGTEFSEAHSGTIKKQSGILAKKLGTVLGIHL